MFLSLAAPFLAYIAGRVARPGEPAPAGPHRGQIFTTAASYPISFAYRIRVVSFGALPAGLIRAARAIVVGAEAVPRPKPVLLAKEQHCRVAGCGKAKHDQIDHLGAAANPHCP